MTDWLKNYSNYSLDGYRANSPDNKKSMNVIPSKNISMSGVNHNVYGIDAIGNSTVMQPGQNYQFEQGPVVEYKMQMGGPSQSMRDNYENAMGWLQSNNYDINNPALRHNPQIGNSYLDAYNKANPTQQFNPADIPVMQQYFQTAPSNRVRTNDPRGFSPIDGFPADQTLNSRQMTYATEHYDRNNNLIKSDSRNFGTNQEAALNQLNYNINNPGWISNNQGIPMTQPISPVATVHAAGHQVPTVQQDNWHTGEDTDYSIDAVRAKKGGIVNPNWLSNYKLS